MNFYLYIINFSNNKKYVGITTNINTRKNKHKNRSNKKEYQHLPLYRAINKYGFDNLEWQIQKNICSSWEELTKLEIKTISELKTNNSKFGYNLTSGGDGHLKYIPSKETRLKISIANKGRPKPPGFSENLSKNRKGNLNPMYGKTTSKKQKEAVSKASRGEYNTNAKLTAHQAAEIRNNFKTGKYLIKELSKIYGLNRNAISKIVRNISYNL